MPAPPPRRLNLLDGMILMAGVAAACLITQVYGAVGYPRFARLLYRYDMATLYSGLTPSGSVPKPFWLTICWRVAEATKVATLWLATFSPIVLWLRLRHPRPTGRRLFRQPGTAATLTATLMTAAGVALWFVAAELAGQSPGLFLYRLGFTRFLVNAGPAIALLWAFQSLAGRWCAERGPVDRAGRLLGAGWILAFLLLAWSDFEERIAVESLPHPSSYWIIGEIQELER